jgi:hypothetical protein
MEKLAKAFVSDAFAQLAQGFLELLSAPRRRVSVGLDCEPWAESGESILRASPWAIAHAIVQAITQSLKSEITALMVIPGIDGSIFPTKPSSPISPERKAKIRTLSSNELFLGLYQSPRASFMNYVHGSMGVEMVASAPTILPEFAAIIHGLSAADLRQRVQFAAACLQITPPNSCQRNDHIAWIETHGARALPFIQNSHQLRLLSQNS